MDLEPRRLTLAKQLGADQVIGPEDDLAAYQGSFDLIYETCGAPPAFAQSVKPGQTKRPYRAGRSAETRSIRSPPI